MNVSLAPTVPTALAARPMGCRPELLLPAGGLERMRAAFDFGADAVYAGQPRYSLRARNNEFRIDQIRTGIEEAHVRGKKFFVTSNLLPHNDKVRTYIRDITPIMAMQPDALIMADPGLIMLVLERWPDACVHLSVQANTLNSASVRFWQKIGIQRIILSRELSLDEIARIRQDCPDIELEVFVHGALCIAYSGRCLLSGYMNHRDSNQGTCTNACRWNYKTHHAQENETGDVIASAPSAPGCSRTTEDAAQGRSACGGVTRHPEADKVYLLEEASRAGDLMPIEEDEHGTYIMNSRDLRALEHVERLAQIGIDALKVEGRTKSVYYVARTAQTYRAAIDDAVAGRPFNPALLADLQGLAHRGYTDGFYQRHHSHEQQNYLRGHSEAHRSQFVGTVIAVEDGWGLIEVKNRFAVGDALEIIHPSGNVTLALQAMRDRAHTPIDLAPGSMHRVWIPLQAQHQGALIARFLPEAV